MSFRFFHAVILAWLARCLVESIASWEALKSKMNATQSAGPSSMSDISGGSSNKGYTDNSFCRRSNCINPLFPGLLDLPRLEKVDWQCATHQLVTGYMDFCKDAVDYDPALPSPSAATPVPHLVKAQEDAAMTMFAYHLSGMGYDFWDYRSPGYSDSDCVRSVWKLVCFTYFPKASAGCKSGEQSLYKRPCASGCQNYILHCGVECCDESVKCTFEHSHTDQADGVTTMVSSGYVDVDGPSVVCTGDAKSAFHVSLILFAVVFGLSFRSFA
jgi:hypothetical protein